MICKTRNHVFNDGDSLYVKTIVLLFFLNFCSFRIRNLSEKKVSLDLAKAQGLVEKFLKCFP